MFVGTEEFGAVLESARSWRGDGTLPNVLDVVFALSGIALGWGPLEPTTNLPTQRLLEFWSVW